jgi:NNP family nitrate/nitrite transporter-like MFS transporter
MSVADEAGALQAEDDANMPTETNENTYDLKVDPKENDRATEIKLRSTARPHMRAFHSAWVSFFMAFFMWFSVSPLLGEIGRTLELSRKDLWISTMCSDVATVVARFIVGPMCDRYGARIPMAIVLCMTSIPTALTGTVHSLTGLCGIRFFMGIAGSSFVMAQYWTSRMFTRDIIGTANSIVAGWGNLGGGVAQLVMGAALFPLFRYVFDDDAEKSWRLIYVFPAVVAVCVGIVILNISDDAPQGLYKDMKKRGQMDMNDTSFRTIISTRNALLLAVLYACSFGVEMTMNNAASLYFQDEFGQSTESAAALASMFGATNLFARAFGGILSDRMNRNFGMRGRLMLQTVTLLCQGAATIAFAYADTLASAIPVMIVFSIFVNATEGAIFGVVPYVNPPITGYISGIVGSGGNVGGFCFGFAFHQLTYKNAFTVMGAVSMMASVLGFFIVSRSIHRRFCLAGLDACMHACGRPSLADAFNHSFD